MKVNIYYGGRGLLDDPTLYVLNKMEEVLQELRVTVERINIYEHKNEIATLPQTMKDADGIILATTIEWLGIGGYMQQSITAFYAFPYRYCRFNYMNHFRWIYNNRLFHFSAPFLLFVRLTAQRLLLYSYTALFHLQYG